MTSNWKTGVSRRQLGAGIGAIALAARLTSVAAATASPRKIMMIRHGEKPTAKNTPPFGLTGEGEQDFDSLTVRGWQRAGALATLFGSPGGPPPAAGLAMPSVIFAARPKGMGVGSSALDGKKSKRPLETIEPLAAKLRLAPDLSFAFGDEAALAQHVLTQEGTVLISWEHERLREIAGHTVGDSPTVPSYPAEWPGDRFDVVWVFNSPASGNSPWNFSQVPQRLLQGDGDAGI